MHIYRYILKKKKTFSNSQQSADVIIQGRQLIAFCNHFINEYSIRNLTVFATRLYCRNPLFKKKTSRMNIGRYVMVMSVIFEGIKRHVDLCTFIMLNADLQIMVISIAPRVLRGTTTCIGAITCFLFVEKFKNKFHLSIVLRAIPWPRLCIFAGKCHKKYGSCGPYYRRLYKCIIFYHILRLNFIRF